jgi:hypothetical protein
VLLLAAAVGGVEVSSALLRAKVAVLESAAAVRGRAKVAVLESAAAVRGIKTSITPVGKAPVAVVGGVEIGVAAVGTPLAAGDRRVKVVALDPSMGRVKVAVVVKPPVPDDGRAKVVDPAGDVVV